MKERLNIIRDIKQTQELKSFETMLEEASSSKLLKSDLTQDISMTLEDASLIRVAKAKAMAAAAGRAFENPRRIVPKQSLRSSGNRTRAKIFLVE